MWEYIKFQGKKINLLQKNIIIRKLNNKLNFKKLKLYKIVK